MSGSGKTELAKAICAKSKRDTLVYDPFYDPEWKATLKTDEMDIFWPAVWHSLNTDIFIDEAGGVLDPHNKAHDKLATQTRIRGHIVTFITQRGAQISPTVRDQCSEIYFFKQALEDLKVYAKAFDNDEILKARDLPKYHCIFYDRGNGDLKILNLTKEIGN